MTNIVRHTMTALADSVAAYLPGGPLFSAKYKSGTVLRRLIEGLSVEVGTAENYLALLCEEFIPDNTTLFLDEWESVLGIPDDCFPQSEDADQRRLFILIKLAALGVQTVEDFQELADKFGLTVTVTPGSEAFNFPLPFPIVFSGQSASRFTIVVTFTTTSSVAVPFPLPFPYPFIITPESILKCLFNKLKPANCQVLFIGD